jgi:hypothetical protein
MGLVLGAGRVLGGVWFAGRPARARDGDRLVGRRRLSAARRRCLPSIRAPSRPAPGSRASRPPSMKRQPPAAMRRRCGRPSGYQVRCVRDDSLLLGDNRRGAGRPGLSAKARWDRAADRRVAVGGSAAGTVVESRDGCCSASRWRPIIQMGSNAGPRSPLGEGFPLARILIVDDNLLCRALLRQILSGAGHEVVGEAQDGLRPRLACTSCARSWSGDP